MRALNAHAATRTPNAPKKNVQPSARRGEWRPMAHTPARAERGSWRWRWVNPAAMPYHPGSNGPGTHAERAREKPAERAGKSPQVVLDSGKHQRGVYREGSGKQEARCAAASGGRRRAPCGDLRCGAHWGASRSRSCRASGAPSAGSRPAPLRCGRPEVVRRRESRCERPAPNGERTARGTRLCRCPFGL